MFFFIKQTTTWQRLNGWWLRYSYKHTTLAVLSIILFVLLIDSAILASFFTALEGLGYVGGFIGGLLSVSFFTAIPALVVIVALATQLDPLLLTLVAALGSAVGDWLLLRFFQERIFDELKPLIKRTGFTRAISLLDRRSTRWILVTSGALIVSTPLPDEIGLGLMGISHFRRLFLAIICLLLNAVGLFVLIMGVNLIVG